MGTKGDNNRARIVEAADQLFYQRGYNQTSFSDIADVTGIPRGNFYYYFKTKDDILSAVVDERVKQFQMMLKQCDSNFDDPRERLHGFVDNMLAYADSVSVAGCPVGSLCTELAKDSDELQVKSREVFALLREWIAKQFSELGVNEADEKALDMLSHMQGAAVISSAFKDTPYLKRSLSSVKDWLNQVVAN